MSEQNDASDSALKSWFEVLLTEIDPDTQCGASRGPGHPTCWLSVDHVDDSDSNHARYGVTWS